MRLFSRLTSFEMETRPEKNWKEKHPTQKQFEFIASLGGYWPKNATRGRLSEIINAFTSDPESVLSNLNAECGSEPAHPKQLEAIQKTGRTVPEGMTKAEAAELYIKIREDLQKQKIAEQRKQRELYSFHLKEKINFLDREIDNAKKKIITQKSFELRASTRTKELEKQLSKTSDEEERDEIETEMIELEMSNADDSTDWEEHIKDLKDERRMTIEDRIAFWQASCGKDMSEKYDIDENPSYFPVVIAYAENYGHYFTAPTIKEIKLILSDLDKTSPNWDTETPAESFFAALTAKFPHRKKAVQENPLKKSELRLGNIEQPRSAAISNRHREKVGPSANFPNVIERKSTANPLKATAEIHAANKIPVIHTEYVEPLPLSSISPRRALQITKIAIALILILATILILIKNKIP